MYKEKLERRLGDKSPRQMWQVIQQITKTILFAQLEVNRPPTHHIITFADDTTLVGLIRDQDESPYRDEVQKLTVWCTVKNLKLNTTKNKEIIIDLRD